MDFIGVCDNPGYLMCHGRSGYMLSQEKEGNGVNIVFAVVGTPLACFAEGAILAASVYLASRGIKNPLRNKKK